MDATISFTAAEKRRIFRDLSEIKLNTLASAIALLTMARPKPDQMQLAMEQLIMVNDTLVSLTGRGHTPDEPEGGILGWRGIP